MEQKRLKYPILQEDQGKSVLSLLRGKLRLSNRLIRQMKQTGGIRLDGRQVYTNYIIGREKELEALFPPETAPETVPADDMPLEICYEDEWMLAVNKAANLVVHPSPGHYNGTLIGAVRNYYQQQGKEEGIHLISRLDRDTTGIVLLAKSPYIQDELRKQGDQGLLQKEYLGIVTPSPKEDSAWIRHPIGRLPGSIIQRRVDEQGAASGTFYLVVKKLKLPHGEEAALLRFRLETGRTHQIRVHCQAEGFPLLGDTLYGIESPYITRQALHAAYLCFRHPVTRQVLQLEAPLPPDIAGLLSM